MSKYTIGIDYGSLSGRAVLVRCDSGEVVAESTMDYPHAVMDAALSDGTPLGQDWALQDPQDYLDVLDAERTLFEAQTDYADAVSSAMSGYVTLYKALGGGITMPVPETD